jgi:hypothetical protein
MIQALCSDVEAMLEPLAPMTLAAVLDAAELQTRTDRKYVLSGDALRELCATIGDGLHALEIDGRRSFAYSSVYFDTIDLRCFRDVVQGRRQRGKVRTRTYLDSGQCVLEVKGRAARGHTVKVRTDHPVDDRRHLDGAARRFVAAHTPWCDPTAELVPVLTTDYRRCTLVDLRDGTRATCDIGLAFVAGDCAGSHGQAASLEHHVVLETKSRGAPTNVDRALWRAGHRPLPLSKFGVGMALSHPGLPANRWHRTIQRYFDRAGGEGA